MTSVPNSNKTTLVSQQDATSTGSALIFLSAAVKTQTLDMESDGPNDSLPAQRQAEDRNVLSIKRRAALNDREPCAKWMNNEAKKRSIKFSLSLSSTSGRQATGGGEMWPFVSGYWFTAAHCWRGQTSSCTELM